MNGEQKDDDKQDSWRLPKYAGLTSNLALVGGNRHRYAAGADAGLPAAALTERGRGPAAIIFSDYVDIHEIDMVDRHTAIVLARSPVSLPATGGRGPAAESLAAFALSKPNPWRMLYRAIDLVGLNRVDEAGLEVNKARKDDPSWTQAYWRSTSFYSNASIVEREVAALAKARLPEN